MEKRRSNWWTPRAGKIKDPREGKTKSENKIEVPTEGDPRKIEEPENHKIGIATGINTSNHGIEDQIKDPSKYNFEIKTVTKDFSKWHW